MSENSGPHERPRSPHLQVYKMTLTMAMSVFHRATGIALYAGTVLLVWWLASAAVGDEYFAFTQGIFGSWFGQLVLFGYTWALFHHMLGGIRHFVWDVGAGFEHNAREAMTLFSLIGALVLTALTWAFVLLA